MSNVYVFMGIWNLCFVYLVYESEKICMQYPVTGITTSIHVYVWHTSSLSPNRIHFSCNAFPPIFNASCYSGISDQKPKYIFDTHR